MKKTLYVDIPFDLEIGGDMNRSRFLWNALKEHYEASRLLVVNGNRKEKGKKSITPQDKTITSLSKVNRLTSQSILKFSPEELSKFKEILLQGRYDKLVFRMCSMANLAEFAAKVLPEADIIIDVDMLFSRLVNLAWNLNRSLKNRYYLIEKVKLELFENCFFRKPFLFLFTNPVERDFVLQHYKIKTRLERYHVLPNVMMANSTIAEPSTVKQEYVLIPGSLDSSANVDAFYFFAHDIYPLIKDKVAEKKLIIRVA